MTLIQNKLLACCLLLCTLLACITVFAASNLPSLNNPSSGQSLPGKFVWFDLATPDFSKQQTFYESLFGWDYRPVPGAGDQYSLILNRNRAIAGIFSFEPEDGSKDAGNWIALMSVTDTDQAVRTVKANGGKVNVAASNVPNRGRHALVEDPGGAMFGLLKSSSGDPADRQAAIGDIMWVDLFALDAEAMADFYAKLAPFSQETQQVSEKISRVLLSTEGTPRAGILPVAEDANRSAWVPYVRVADVEAVLEKVVTGGGFAIVEPDPGLLDGNLAIFIDPNGSVVGIVKWEYGQGSGS